MENINDLLSYYVASLRSLYLIHQNNHWNTKGDDFYGNHLLFERIYKTAAENADLAAEKFIGLFGHDSLTLASQGNLINKIIEKYADEKDLIKLSLTAEQDFLKFAELAYKQIKKDDKMTLGLDDAIMSISSDREGAVYLLQNASTDTQSNDKTSARIKFITRIKNAQWLENKKNAVIAEAIKQAVILEIEHSYNGITVDRSKTIFSYMPAKQVKNIKTNASCVANLSLIAKAGETPDLRIKIIKTTQAIINKQFPDIDVSVVISVNGK